MAQRLGLAANLGLPTRLSEIDTVSQKDLQHIAELTVAVPHAQTNPRKATNKDEVLELLHAAW